MGGPSFEPTEEQRRTVKTMAGYGVRHEDIASCIQIDPKTLRKHFRAELDEGMALGNMNVGRSLYEMAVGRPAQYDDGGRLLREEMKPDKSAVIFAAKARLGMRETTRLEHTGPNGGPIQTIDLDLSVFTDEELKLFMRLYDKAKRRGGDDDEGGAPPADPG